MFSFFRKLFSKQQLQSKFHVGEKVNVFSGISTSPGDQHPSIFKEATILSVEIEPAKIWYKVRLYDDTYRTVHENSLKKIEKK